MNQQSIGVFLFIFAVSLTVRVDSVPDESSPFRDRLVGGRVSSKSKSDDLYEQAKKFLETNIPVYVLPDRFFPETDRDVVAVHDSASKVDKYNGFKAAGKRAEFNKNKQMIEVFFLTQIDRFNNIMLTIMNTVLKIMAIFN